MIDTIVFDFDGVIIDTETPQFRTWAEVFHSHGVELDRMVWQKIIGGGTVRFDAFDHLQELVDKTLDRSEVFESKRERYESRIKESPVLSGVEEYLKVSRRLGLKIGVASSSSRDWVEGNLAKRGLLSYFDRVVCRDDVAKVKPDPELYLTVTGLLGSSSMQSVAIEDSYNGLTSAKEAGMFCVVVPNPMTEDMKLDRADVRLGSLSEVDLEKLLAMLDT